MRVALFTTCFNDTLFPDTGRAVVTVLERLGHQVEFPEEQTCCGQMHFNTGYADDGLALARRFERVFEPYEAIVSPSASCVGMVREHCPAQTPVHHERIPKLHQLINKLGAIALEKGYQSCIVTEFRLIESRGLYQDQDMT